MNYLIEIVEDGLLGYLDESTLQIYLDLISNMYRYL
jgi:hypothetical protein